MIPSFKILKTHFKIGARNTPIGRKIFDQMKMQTIFVGFETHFAKGTKILVQIKCIALANSSKVLRRVSITN